MPYAIPFVHTTLTPIRADRPTFRLEVSARHVLGYVAGLVGDREVDTEAMWGKERNTTKRASISEIGVAYISQCGKAGEGGA